MANNGAQIERITAVVRYPGDDTHVYDLALPDASVFSGSGLANSDYAGYCNMLVNQAANSNLICLSLFTGGSVLLNVADCLSLTIKPLYQINE